MECCLLRVPKILREETFYERFEEGRKTYLETITLPGSLERDKYILSSETFEPLLYECLKCWFDYAMREDYIETWLEVLGYVSQCRYVTTSNSATHYSIAMGNYINRINSIARHGVEQLRKKAAAGIKDSYTLILRDYLRRVYLAEENPEFFHHRMDHRELDDV